MIAIEKGFNEIYVQSYFNVENTLELRENCFANDFRDSLVKKTPITNIIRWNKTRNLIGMKSDSKVEIGKTKIFWFTC